MSDALLIMLPTAAATALAVVGIAEWRLRRVWTREFPELIRKPHE